MQSAVLEFLQGGLVNVAVVVVVVVAEDLDMTSFDAVQQGMSRLCCGQVVIQDSACSVVGKLIAIAHLVLSV